MYQYLLRLVIFYGIGNGKAGYVLFESLLIHPVSSYPDNSSSFPKSFIGNPYSAVDSRQKTSGMTDLLVTGLIGCGTTVFLILYSRIAFLIIHLGY